MHDLDSHQTYCLANAIYFTAVRGRNPASRTRIQFATMADAIAYGASFGDNRTMIYAIAENGHADHIMNS